MLYTTPHQRMILCAGMQSGGTTLVSWCFLQRRDTNGVLDMPHHNIQVSFERVREPLVWCKATIASFRWLDIRELYRDLGWSPEPLLVVRDVRAIYTSLSGKWYGTNGTTADDPPLRMKFRRFLSDWQLFRQEGWPIIKYEDLIARGGDALVEICRHMHLQWDESMITWPKKIEDIAYIGQMNETFRSSLENGSLVTATLSEKAGIPRGSLPVTDLNWLEEQFSEYNTVHGYLQAVPDAAAPDDEAQMQTPRYEGTISHWLYSELWCLRNENYRLQQENEMLKRGEAVNSQPGRQ